MKSWLVALALSLAVFALEEARIVEAEGRAERAEEWAEAVAAEAEAWMSGRDGQLKPHNQPGFW